MKLLRTLALVLISLIILTACQQPGGESAELTPEERQLSIEKGTEASDALMKNLGSQLKSALAAGDPVSAVQVCQQIAMPLTDSTSEQFAGINVGRTSLKPRNPDNAPGELDWEILEAWQSQKDLGKALPEHELRRISDTEVVFYRPIMVQSVCLNCHGPIDSLTPELQAHLEAHYPEDQAIGYAEGDLRGAFVVEIDLSVVSGT